MNVTDKELELIAKLATSEYQEDESFPNEKLWAACEITTKEEGGVLSSLIKKGLAGFEKHPKSNGSDNDLVWLTDAGIELWKANK